MFCEAQGWQRHMVGRLCCHRYRWWQQGQRLQQWAWQHTDASLRNARASEVVFGRMRIRFMCNASKRFAPMNQTVVLRPSTPVSTPLPLHTRYSSHTCSALAPRCVNKWGPFPTTPGAACSPRLARWMLHPAASTACQPTCTTHACHRGSPGRSPRPARTPVLQSKHMCSRHSLHIVHSPSHRRCCFLQQSHHSTVTCHCDERVSKPRAPCPDCKPVNKSHCQRGAEQHSVCHDGIY